MRFALLLLTAVTLCAQLLDPVQQARKAREFVLAGKPDDAPEIVRLWLSGRSQVAEAMLDSYTRLDRREVDAGGEVSDTFAPCGFPSFFSL